MKSTITTASVLFLFLIALTAQAGLIDSFGTNQSLFLNVQASVPASQHDEGYVTDLPSVILGGERDATLDWVSGGRYYSLDVNYESSGVLEFSQGASGKSRALLVWDGTDSSVSLPPSSMSPAVDLTDGLTNTGLAVDVLFNDLPIDLNITLYTNTGTVSATMALPGSITSNTTFYVPFTAFAGANAGSVSAITMQIDGTTSAGADLTIDNFRSAVPEPGSLLLLGIATALGFSLLRWKK
jgi:hypothetical protein